MIDYQSANDTFPDISDLPVLIICYARASNVRNLIIQLRKLGIVKIYVAIDGPKSRQIAEIQDDLIHDLHNFSRFQTLSINIWQRTENLGIAVSVITALDWFFSREERGAILEDDLIVDDSFFKYLNYFLQVLKQDTSITLISGTRPTALNFQAESLLFSNYPQTWGWGTWVNRWSEIRSSAYKSGVAWPNFSLNPVKNFWRYGARRVLEGKIDTWDIPLAYYMLSGRRTSLLPPVNLVSNIGGDAFATHTLNGDNLLNQKTQSLFELPEIDLLSMMRNVEQVNYILEKKVFGIKGVHALLPIYSLFDFVRRGFLRKDSLENRLKKVIIP